MAEDRREQELRAAAKQLAGVQRQHRPNQKAAAQIKSGQQTVATQTGSGQQVTGQTVQQARAAAQSQAGQKAQPQRAVQQAAAQTAAAQPQAGQKAQPQRAAQQATAQTAAAQPQAGQKAQPQRAAQQATAQTAHSNGSGKALSGQQIQQMRTTNTPAKESMSQTKQIQHQLEQEVADIMDAESFADLVFIDPDPLPETSKKAEGRTGFFAKRNKDKETDAATKADTKAATKAETPQSKDKETAVSAGNTEYKETAVDKTAEQAQEADKQEEQIEKLQKWGRIGQWFQTFCWMHIPIFGFWYMVVLAVRKRTPEEKKTFARAYVLYRVLVMLLALTILYVFYRMGLSFVEQILAYIDMHS